MYHNYKLLHSLNKNILHSVQESLTIRQWEMAASRLVLFFYLFVGNDRKQTKWLLETSGVVLHPALQ